VELKGVFTITMGCKAFHIFGEIDDFDGLEGAFFNADTTTNTEYLRDFTHG
jgi:hypothetical protein